MLGEEFVHERAQFRKLPRDGEEMFFFCVEVVADFLLEMLLNLGLPGFQFRWARQRGAVDAHA